MEANLSMKLANLITIQYLNWTFTYIITSSIFYLAMQGTLLCVFQPRHFHVFMHLCHFKEWTFTTERRKTLWWNLESFFFWTTLRDCCRYMLLFEHCSCVVWNQHELKWGSGSWSESYRENIQVFIDVRDGVLMDFFVCLFLDAFFFCVCIALPQVG